MFVVRIKPLEPKIVPLDEATAYRCIVDNDIIDMSFRVIPPEVCPMREVPDVT